MVAGDDHHPARQRHRADSDDPQRPRRNQVRNLLPGALQGELRCARRQHRRDSARYRRLRMVRNSNLDRSTGARRAVQGGVVGLGQHTRQCSDRVRHLLGNPGRDHSQRNRRNQDSRELVGATAFGRRRSTASMGDQKRRRDRPHPERVAKTAERSRVVLVAFPGRPDGERRLLGDAQSQHSGFHSLCQEPALAGARTGAWFADDDDRIRVHWCRGHECDDRDLWPGDLGSGGSR